MKHLEASYYNIGFKMGGGGGGGGEGGGFLLLEAVEFPPKSAYCIPMMMTIKDNVWGRGGGGGGGGG